MRQTAMEEVLLGKGNRYAKMRRIEWLGQTAASLCWLASVLVYGLSSGGDWLQLLAAASWLVANIAVIIYEEND